MNAAKTVSVTTTPNTYTVKFNSNGGSGSTMISKTYTYDQTYTLPANTYTMANGFPGSFHGWSTSIDSNGHCTSNRYLDKGYVKNLVTSGTITLYADWGNDPYTVTVHSNRSTDVTYTKTAYYNEPMDAHYFYTDSTLKDNGDGFGNCTGFNTKADGTGTHYDLHSGKIKNVKVLYAEYANKQGIYYKWTSTLSKYGSYLGSATQGAVGSKSIRYTRPDGVIAYADPYQAGHFVAKQGTKISLIMIAGDTTGTSECSLYYNGNQNDPDNRNDTLDKYNGGSNGQTIITIGQTQHNPPTSGCVLLRLYPSTSSDLKNSNRFLWYVTAHVLNRIP